ncbi:hypothetical protein Acr_15g0003540 [Actinidia rufa]|uniref:Uncharacterized protein n=1 Tax=Actinidia rufa TaxID=165716 RepID=A0A7J0FSS9_9ERIC|nr:hypothetical protein Acr_15g0003540 [Actinidia rufa]
MLLCAKGLGECTESRERSAEGESGDPCLEFAFKTLTGAIPIEDNIAIQGYFQQQDDTSNPQTDGCLSLPEIGLPNFFQSNISSDFATVGKSVSVLKLPENETKVSDRGGEKKEQKREKEAVEDVGRLLSMVKNGGTNELSHELIFSALRPIN